MITDEDRRYFASLRVIARLLAVARVGRYWPTAMIPDDERAVLDDALALVGGYKDTGEHKDTVTIDRAEYAQLVATRDNVVAVLPREG